LAAEYEASGLTREAFCRERDLPLKTLCRYVTQYRRQKAGALQSPRFVQVELAAPARVTAAITVLLPGGRRIEARLRCLHASSTANRAGAGLIMFGIGPATRIYLAAGATDMRKNFEGLYGLVRDRLACDPLSGHVFLFSNAQRNRLKLIFWDGSGLWVCAKRLEKGRFRWPETKSEECKIVLSQEELMLLLGGIDLTQTRPRAWHRVTRPA
jgi:transposase